MKSSNNLEKMLKTDGHYEGNLVSLDFKSQSLQKFLENVVQLVNQHSQRINQLEMEKITIQDVKKGNQKLMNSNKIPTSLINELPTIKQGTKFETNQEFVDGICTNMQLNSHAIHYLHQQMKKKDQTIRELQSALDGLQKSDAARQNIRKTQQMAKKYTDDEIAKVLTRIKEAQMKNNKKIGQFQNLTKEVQKKTLYKISECQSSLLKKVTPQYVERACDQLELKIHNDIKNNKTQDLNQLKFNLETLKSKFDGLSKDVEEKQKQNKQWLKDLSETSKLLEKKQKVEQDKRQLETKIKQTLIKIDRLQKREDPQDLELRISKQLLELREKSNYSTDKIKKLESSLDSINNVMSSIGGADGTGMDPHKLCHIDGQVKRLKDSNRTNQSKISTLQDELKTKLTIFEQRIMTTLGMLKGQDNFVSRQEMYESLTRLREPVTQRLTQNQNLMHELSGKLSKLQLFEKATKRKIKQLTKGDQLNKILDMKLNSGQAQAQFNSMNMKLQNLEIVLNKTKMQIDAAAAFISDLQHEMNDPEEGINIIGPKQKVFPAKCLGCGTKHIPPVYDNNMMMGTDGKYYKVDLKGTGFSDQMQVYGVTPSQIAVYENNSMSASRKKIVSNSNRPTSGRSNAMRPMSANRY